MRFMKKRFLSAFFFLVPAALFPLDLFAQNEANNRVSVRVQVAAYVGGSGNSNAANDSPASAAETAKTNISKLEQKVLELINEQRAAQNLEPLRWSEAAAKIARLHAEDMARFKFFNHVGRDGLSVDERADANGLSKWRAIGENIAYNRGFENPAEFALSGWLKSAPHRQNLLNDRWRETGIGVALADDGTYYFTQVFLVR